jgi:hypothetical protein
MFLEQLMMYFAIQAGTVPRHPPTVHVSPAARHRVVRPHKKVVLHPPVPRPRPTALIPQALSATTIAVPTTPSAASLTPVQRAIRAPLSMEDAGPYPFKWTNQYALPPAWVQIWKYVG